MTAAAPPRAASGAATPRARPSAAGGAGGGARALVLAPLGLAALAVGWALARALAWRVPLARLYDGAFDATLAGLAVSAAFTLAALGAWLAVFARGVRPRGLFPLRWALAVLVLAWGLFLAFVQPFERLHLDLAAGLAGGAYAAVMLVEALRAAHRGRVLRAADFALFQVALVLCAAELGLRVWGRVAPAPVLALGGVETRNLIEAFRPRPGELRLGFPFNASGHYDDPFVPKAPGERLVASIGDSFAEGVVPHAHHYTTVAERELGLPVYNYGVPSTGLPEYLWLLRHEVLAVRPDVVVVTVFVGNDLRDSPNKTPTDRGLRRLFDRESVAVWIVPQRILAAREAARRLAAAGGAVAGGAPVAPGEQGEPGVPADAAPWLADPLLEKPTIPEPTFLRIEAQRAVEICVRGARDYEYTCAKLRELVETAAPIPLAFVLIPDEFQVDEALWEAVLAHEHVRAYGDGLELVRDLPQERLGAWLSAEGIPFVDLLPLLRAVPPLADGRPHVYHRNDTHFNARGNAVAGRAIAELVRGLLPPR